MATREEALAFIMKNQKRAKMLALQEIEKHLSSYEHLPPEIRAKFLGAGDGYGEFILNQNWLKELESEAWDSLMYAGLEIYRREMFE